jgi:hypothetical protein
MPRNNGPSGPYITPPPPPPPPLALYIPENVTETVNDEQRAQIAQIELEFGRQVASLVAKSYADILAVLRLRQDAD